MAKSTPAERRARRRLEAQRAAGVDPLPDFVPDAKTRKAQMHRKFRTRTPREKQNPDDPQPIAPRGPSQRGGKQTAEELRDPPRRPGKNGGWLQSGGTNKGGKGATPAELRQRCRNALELDDIFAVPLEVIRDPFAKPAEKMRAWEALARFGGLTAVSLTDGDGNPLELPPFIVQTIAKTKADPTLGEA